MTLPPVETLRFLLPSAEDGSATPFWPGADLGLLDISEEKPESAFFELVESLVGEVACGIELCFCVDIVVRIVQFDSASEALTSVS